AWATFQRERFDVCVLDVMLPGFDGFTLAEQIRAHNASVPILFLSARADKIDRLHGLRLGADDYLTKPFSIEELILKISVFLRRAGLQTALSNPTAAKPPWPATAHLLARPLGTYHFQAVNLLLTHPAQTQTLTQREADVLEYLLD
ncbi:response regulator transcription factor, partial [Pseudomonas aeruginosa]|uniref:response regulator transcription factor n=1 Tax=Pseudomonas aeruginosa TaxID=287 RepID=UPI0020960BC3